VDGLGVLRYPEARLGGALRKAKIRKRGCNDVKRRPIRIIAEERK
jgi:hypothetical protein